jgi:L,D-transpeptidase YbiS
MNQQIIISLRDQRLQLREGENVLMDIPVSTAKNGPGEVNGSECTPRGWHYVRAKIGAEFPNRDWILTRILWLSGLEPGKNRLGSVDTMRRYIYIHGCPDEDTMGIPGSHGCIKMHNDDVINLFEAVPVGVGVLIVEEELPSKLPIKPLL